MIQTNVITPTLIQNAMTYQAYRQLIDDLLVEGKTTGPIQSEAMTHYTEMNVVRMKRLDKRTQLNETLIEQLAAIDKPLIWLVISEAWCGDAAQIVPVLATMADQTPNIELKLILRDHHLDIMDAYLTNGARGIPKLIVLDATTLEEIATWGPRPQPAQELLYEYKTNPNESYAEFSKRLQLWYARDKTVHIQKELSEMISTFGR
ncbi:MAG: thioredoxin family protein [Chitinophagales bacterium]